MKRPKPIQGFKKFVGNRKPVIKEVLREPTAVEERRVADDLGMDVLQPIAGKPELVVPHHRAVLQDDMRRAAGIVAEARQREFLGDHVAAKDRAAFQHQAAIAGLGQISRRHQAVVTRASHDDVELVRHAPSIP